MAPRMRPMYRPSITIDLTALDRNLRAIQAEAGTGAKMMAVVKSDAYGHGLERIVTRAVANGVDWFAVAYLHEARRVRAVAPEVDVLILGVVEPSDVPVLVAERLTPVVVSREHGEALAAAATAAGADLSVHIKVDSGMGRLGVFGPTSVADLIALVKMPGLHVTGICSHFATIHPARPYLAGDQWILFQQAVEVAEHTAGRRLVRHMSSSRAMQFHPEWDLDLIRPGILLYGYGCGESGMRVKTEPLLEWRTRVMQVKTVPEDTPIGYYASYRTLRETDIATIATGYADGYLRSLSNRGYALVGGERRAVVGRVSMNWVTLDLGPESGVKAGDEVVLIGPQEEGRIDAVEMSRWAGTIAYETLTAIHPAIPRTYVE